MDKPDRHVNIPEWIYQVVIVALGGMFALGQFSGDAAGFEAMTRDKFRTVEQRIAQLEQVTHDNEMEIAKIGERLVSIDEKLGEIRSLLQGRAS